ncbi:TetR/AcrR family transcriptional regulator [Paenibacillus odorifer]|uniref:TetR/AcrR family transcriptional regulator n=1 Tax=Paenibacillus odorifer TaxID=189426 RepID=UPI00096EDC37|nr:TetR/AcrR family transcriptional regulator [Paenibacillus odorifer]OMD70034.1 hypothetical protein BSK50_28615 [Paenibacillus odorifer]
MKKKVLTERQLKSQQVKENIHNAAIRMLKEYEYDYLTVRNVCKEANVSTGTFYHHFKNKDDLLTYYLAYGYEKYMDENEILFEDDVKKNIAQIYHIYISYCMEMGIEFLSNYYSTKNKSLNTRDKHSPEEIHKVPFFEKSIIAIKHGQEQEFISPDVDIHEAANDICTLVKGLIFEWCLTDGSYDLQKNVQKILRIYLNSIVTEAYRALYE